MKIVAQHGHLVFIRLQLKHPDGLGGVLGEVAAPEVVLVGLPERDVGKINREGTFRPCGVGQNGGIRS